ncbi:PHD finger protein ING1 isoform X2 [Amaranthus tricolor]|nr:PHD finger protein ING1 isoform X2 [Amaranthus tricolor]
MRQNERRCEQEIEGFKQGMLSGAIPPEPSRVRLSDEALDEQKHSIRIADEKVALAVQAYDLVDAHIQQLDQYLKQSEEEIRREKELASAPASSDATAEGSSKSGRGIEGGRGGRKKTRHAAAAAAAAAASVPANPPSMDLDIPVDPNEPTYCICNQVSYGEMVACDNSDCRIEWFHFGCVGLKEKPKGKWYCTDCAGTQKRRKGK